MPRTKEMSMAEAQPTRPQLPNPGEQLAALQRIAERSRRVAELWLDAKDNGGSTHAGPTASMALAQDFLAAATRLMLRPDQLVQAHAQLWQDYLALAHHTTQRLMGQASEPVIEPARDDRRFKGEAWQDPVFDLIKQAIS
jgi:polyhydroxyalkanoate synthase